MIKKISTDKAPAAIGPYSQAVKTDSLIFVSGQIPVDPETGKLVDGIEDQTKQVFENIKAVLKAAGSDLTNVVKVTVFLSDMDNFQVVNNIYSCYFTGSTLPARCAVEVGALPKGSLVEIECIAVC